MWFITYKQRERLSFGPLAVDNYQQNQLVLNHETIVDEDFPAYDPEARSFFNRYNGITISTSSSNFLIKTKTVASLIQTTISSTSTVFCVPAIEFSSSAFLTPCSANGRRRRDVASLLDMLQDIKRQQRSDSDSDLEEEDSIISPYAVEPLETTAGPSTGLFGSSDRMKKDLSASNDAIDSSKEPEDDADWDERKKRSFFGSIGGLFVATSTISITNCTTTVTTTTSTLTLGTSGAVTCLPSGLTTC